MLFTARNFDVVDVLREVAQEAARTMAEVALAWVVGRSGVSSVLIGASRAEQVAQNIAALDVELTADQRARLNHISAPPSLNPYFIFNMPTRRIFGGEAVAGWSSTERPPEVS